MRADSADAAFHAPVAGYREQVFYHDLPADKDGFSTLSLCSPLAGVQVDVACRRQELPVMVQWKMMGQGAYVTGIEPANCRVGGRAARFFFLSVFSPAAAIQRFHTRKSTQSLPPLSSKRRLAGQRRRIPPASNGEAREERLLGVREGGDRGAESANEARPSFFFRFSSARKRERDDSLLLSRARLFYTTPLSHLTMLAAAERTYPTILLATIVVWGRGKAMKKRGKGGEKKKEE